ncbi:PAAR domain-containing protein [Spartinivicinus ruber]|uniref:PAAR domain-containing protein n=1 Tax=Spartinivicinus ruber TaxID=2683272 RepID=UPI0013D134D3|nr:PAAR domain-containing protein [Spartinivicinus ruber]
MAFAARLGDMHLCPMQTTTTPSVPHVGGTITGPGITTVLIGGVVASVVGDSCICAGDTTGGTDTISQGSATVMIGGKSAVRIGDMTGHGGSITGGSSNVMIGG